jgi:hypothetical protein
VVDNQDDFFSTEAHIRHSDHVETRYRQSNDQQSHGPMEYERDGAVAIFAVFEGGRHFMRARVPPSFPLMQASVPSRSLKVRPPPGGPRAADLAASPPS